MPRNPANGRGSIRIEVRRVPPDFEIGILQNVLDLRSARVYRAGCLAHLSVCQRIELGERGVFAFGGSCDQK
jgi:hypothetical protein